MTSINFNAALIKALNLDEKHYMYKLKIKISRLEQSTSGIRRSTSKFIDATPHYASELPLFELANLRNIQIANLANFGLYPKTPEEIVDMFNSVVKKESVEMPESQKDALAAVLFTNWMWRVKDSDLVPASLQKYAIDLDSCAGKGKLRTKKMKTLSDEELKEVHEIGIWPRDKLSVTLQRKVDEFLRKWLDKVAIALSGTVENFITQYKPKQTVFSKKGLWKLGTWGTPMHSGGRSKATTDALCLPAGCPIGTQDSQVFNAAIRIEDKDKGKEISLN
jgi:hypothetical protein